MKLGFGLALVLGSMVFACSTPTVEGGSLSHGQDKDDSADTADGKDTEKATGTASSDTNGDQTTEHTDGMPEMTNVSYLGIPNVGFPTYLSHLVGSKYHLFPNVEIKNPTSTAQRVVLRGELTGYTKTPTKVTLDLAPGETKSGFFDATLDFEALGKLTAEVTATFQISLETTDGKVINARSKPMSLLPKNTVLWAGVFGDDTGFTEKEAVIGVLTTPHDGDLRVDSLLKSAAQLSNFHAMEGYQYHKANSTQDDDIAGANDQLGSIYTALKQKGFNYTSVGAAFFSGRQNVRYPSESLAVSSANCIDGSLVFASALESIGMDAFVVFPPGHAFVGVHAGPTGTPGHDMIIVVETTMLGTSDYVTARDRARDEYTAGIAAKNTSVIHIKTARADGFLPSPM